MSLAHENIPARERFEVTRAITFSANFHFVNPDGTEYCTFIVPRTRYDGPFSELFNWLHTQWLTFEVYPRFEKDGLVFGQYDAVGGIPLAVSIVWDVMAQIYSSLYDGDSDIGTCPVITFIVPKW